MSVIVVGSGIAGLTCALTAAARGIDVTLITKSGLRESSTWHAQGGIAAALSGCDSPHAHARDTLVAGAGLSDPDAVAVLADEGADRVRELIELGVPFDRDAHGAIIRGLEAAHSCPRILHAGGDATGAAIHATLAAAVRTEGRIAVREHTFCLDLNRRDDGSVSGVSVLTGGQLRQQEADAVVLATGGAGQLYSRTSNPSVVTGDGIAMAIRAGAQVQDLEFVQFHPTVLAGGEPFLISEAVRGEGAWLRDRDGHRFMLTEHPDAELAPRDVVARAIAFRIRAQDGEVVLLDARHLTASFARDRFPSITAQLNARGLDLSRDLIPVTPAAHYLMGGVRTDLDGRSTIPGLYAVGETARTGVHGANRLASNSLLEGAVFGARAAAALADDSPHPAPAGALAAASSALLPGSASALPGLRPASPAPVTEFAAYRMQAFSRIALQDLMWQHAGLLRNAAGLERAAAVIAGWQQQQQRERRAASSSTERTFCCSTDLAELENRNLLDVAAATVAAALARDESAGAHYRTDTQPALAAAGASC